MDMLRKMQDSTTVNSNDPAADAYNHVYFPADQRFGKEVSFDKNKLSLQNLCFKMCR
jgi:hypothetical protein